jgi:hypothetical protein
VNEALQTLKYTGVKDFNGVWEFAKTRCFKDTGAGPRA